MIDSQRFLTAMGVSVFLICCAPQESKHETRYLYYDSASKRIKVEAQFANGKLHGTSVEYYENGAISSISHWDKGKLNGVLENHRPDSTMQIITHYSFGAKEKQEEFDSTSCPTQPLEEAMCWNGILPPMSHKGHTPLGAAPLVWAH